MTEKARKKGDTCRHWRCPITRELRVERCENSTIDLEMYGEIIVLSTDEAKWLTGILDSIVRDRTTKGSKV